MNPIGKVFSLEELNLIAELCIKYDVMCISDEVYEWMVYEPTKHTRIGKTYLEALKKYFAVLHS